MSKNRWVNDKFWSDTYISELDPIEKLLFLYCITNELVSLCGAYEISLKRIALDTGIDKEMIIKIISRFAADDKIGYVHGHLVVKNHRKHQAENPNIALGVEREINALPEPVKETLTNAFQSVSKASNTLLNFTLLNSRPSKEANVAKAPAVERRANETFLFWESQINGISTTVETQKKSCITLQNKYGLEACIRAIEIVCAAHQDRYARKEVKCMSPTSLLNNWDKVMIYAKSKWAQQKSEEIETIF